MRVALVHDWLVVNGGAEKVTKALREQFNADVFALVDFLDADDRRDILGSGHARTTFIQRMPFARRWFRWYLPLFPAAIRRLDLRGYDLILSSSYAVAKGVRRHPGQVHVCYIHTPMRYAWVQEDSYLSDHGMRGPLAWFIRWQLARLRAWDLRSNAGVDVFIANSHNVAERVRRYYGRPAEVVHPPVDPAIFTLAEGPRTGYLVVSRLVPYKHIDRIIAAFAGMPDRTLDIVGEGPERERLEGNSPPNVRFHGAVSAAEVVRRMGAVKALVVAADEDMGLTPVEALACGTPVIALGRGGYLESVSDGVNGVLFPEPTPEHIAAAVERLEREGLCSGPAELRATAAPFFLDVFRTQVKRIVAASMGHA
jgi:glycosyltransferase involved in cell wall biosynthesis